MKNNKSTIQVDKLTATAIVGESSITIPPVNSLIFSGFNGGVNNWIFKINEKEMVINPNCELSMNEIARQFLLQINMILAKEEE